MSYETKTREEVTGETDKFLFCLSLGHYYVDGCDKTKIVRIHDLLFGGVA